MDRTLLPSLGIVAGIMTLAYYVGGSKEVRWADSTEGLFCPSCKDNTRMDEDEEWCHLCEASYEAESFSADSWRDDCPACGEPSLTVIGRIQCENCNHVVEDGMSISRPWASESFSAEDNSYCANCLRTYPYEEEDDAYIFCQEGDEFWTVENYGVLCRECHPDFQHQDSFGNWTRKPHLAVRPYEHEKKAESFSAEPSTKIPGYAALPFKGFRVAYEHDDEIIKYYDNLREIVSDFNEGHILDTDTGYLRIEFRPVKKLGAESFSEAGLELRKAGRCGCDQDDVWEVVNVESPVFLCGSCGYAGNKKEMGHFGAESETFESPVSCNICGKTFDSFRGLNGHMNAHIPAHRKRAESFAAEVPDKYKEPFKVPVVKIYGENGAIVIGHGVREYLIQEIQYAWKDTVADLHNKGSIGISKERIEESLQKASTQELADMLDKLLKSNGEQGASLEYHDMDGWVGWQIPDFERE